VPEFIAKLRIDNRIEEGIYNSINDYLTLQRIIWKEQNAVPLVVFESCIDLINSLSGKNRFLSEEDKERIEDINDEIYGVLMGFE
jgi:hypothetical protein